ncbi:uncharacterized protein LOC120776384 [Bactrocera tryoni]|uniref:uncharacterized protein LOC120776384 n=1 Tax=Bactrocera tryoni TaxID=59916 RepID=UPI001A99A5DD|nr:uncharacterized protein LOC120776384 [Bactrocera tryoni]
MYVILSTNMDINLLISEVFARPALWDRKNKNYHNRQLVEHLWKSVAREMNLKKEEVKKKWKYIRDQFRAELRKISVPISADSANMESDFNSKWPYFKQLLFLKDQMKHRELSGNLKKISTIPDESGNEDPLEVNDDISSWNISPVEDTDDTCDKFELNIPPPTKKKFLSHTKNTSHQLEIEKRKLRLIEKKHSEKKERDEDQAFFESLLPHVRKLEPESKLLCRMDIQNTVYNHVYQKYKKHPIVGTYTQTPISNDNLQ